MLRATDHLAQPATSTLQTLLLLGNVLQNDMKPDAAWVLGGNTIRLAQCLRLHTMDSQPSLPRAELSDEAKNLR